MQITEEDNNNKKFLHALQTGSPSLLRRQSVVVDV
jgi:hypothetical protein